MKNSNYTIGNRTRDLPACTAVPQPTALRCAPLPHCYLIVNTFLCNSVLRTGCDGAHLIPLIQDSVRLKALAETNGEFLLGSRTKRFFTIRERRLPERFHLRLLISTEAKLPVFMEDIPLCSKLYMNTVKQAPSKHNFYYNVVNNSLMATGFGHKTIFRPHTKNTASYCTRKCMPTFPSQSPVPVIKLNTYYGIPSIK